MTATAGAAAFLKTQMPKSGELEADLDHRDVSLYFHIPFCSRKCPYCHFFVVPDHERYKDPFLQALRKEWHLRKDQLKNKRIVSIYFGGGTPTKLEAEAIEGLLNDIAREADLTDQCEITLEANPEDASYVKMLAFRAAGVNRISLGVQSLVDEELKVLNRQHTAAEALEAIHRCKRAGFHNISIDLMYELPTQTLSSWKRTLLQLESLPITHLSLYNLTFEPYTIFFKKRTELQLTLASEEERLSMLECALAHLEKIGLYRYEISAFAHLGMHSRHNIGYWLARPFIGLGPSAFSYWDSKRFSNTADLHRYTQALEQKISPVDFEERLPFPRDLQELLAVQLRLLSGVDMASFQARHGSFPQRIWVALEEMRTRGWLTSQGQQWRLTEQGTLFYDSVASELMD